MVVTPPVENTRAEPWVLIAGGVLLLALSWGSGVEDARGPQIILTVFALLALHRGIRALMSRAPVSEA